MATEEHPKVSSRRFFRLSTPARCAGASPFRLLDLWQFHPKPDDIGNISDFSDAVLPNGAKRGRIGSEFGHGTLPKFSLDTHPRKNSKHIAAQAWLDLAADSNDIRDRHQ